MQLTGIHHLTAISANAPGNKKFYTDTMGMRMVKKTVNQDDTSAYHLFYADALARPGTDLTFFDWPATPERRGTHSIVRTGLRIAGAESFKWWKERLNEAGVKTGEIAERDGRITLDFEDPEGQRLSLIDDGGAGEAFPWEKSPVPAAQQIRGLGPITMSVPELRATDAALTGLMGMRRIPCMCTRWAKAVRARSCTSRCSRTCGRRSRAPARCITSRSARRTPTTTPGPSG
jgi:glyoxalase family protein